MWTARHPARWICTLAIAAGFITMFGVARPVHAAREARRPNVVLIITDDQGYGDIAAHGNPVIRTPNLDRLHAQSVRLTDFHVDPTCSPTRSSLMTGRYSTRTGVWHTINGRSMMHGDELTLAEIFKSNGYRTAMFGKWHLGDNDPLRPQDQGFEHVVWHQGGGVGQGPDYFGNDYFDDHYDVNGQWRKFEGYCTDVWFREAMRYIEARRDEPFFVYLSTNAPHGPLYVADEHWKPYAEKGVPEPMARFYGMITNIDDNVGRLRQMLAERGLAENTLLIFMTDNGTANGATQKEGWHDGQWHGFNAGMRGRKGSQYDGGHGVPCFIHWPAGGMTGGRDIADLTAHIDMLPTLVELCDLDKPEGRPIDGRSLAGLLKGRKMAPEPRTLFVHSQRIHMPEKWRASAVMTERWRLVDGKLLFDIEADPSQQRNIAGEHPQVVEQLRREYESWWSSLEPAFGDVVRIAVGGAENPVRLMSHDWFVQEGYAPWNQSHVNSGKPENGPWMLDVKQPGRYTVTLYRWPPEAAGPIRDRFIPVTKARIKIGDIDVSKPVAADAEHVSFDVELPAWPVALQSWLMADDGRSGGAFYATVRRP